MKDIIVATLWFLSTTLVGGQYPQMMQMHQQHQHPMGPRSPPVGVMRLRGPVVVSRWGQASNQIQATAPRPYKFAYPYVKGSPYAQRYYGTPKPVASTKFPYHFANMWKTPAASRPVFKSPPPMMGHPYFPSQSHSGPTSAQKLIAASSPVKSMMFSSSPAAKNILSYGNLAAFANTPASPVVYRPSVVYTSQPMTTTTTTTTTPAPLHMAYPIRVDGPIHTIPAPDLTLTDKPIFVPEYHRYLESQSNKFKAPHTYEVTEEPMETSISEKRLPQNYFSSAFNHHSFLPQAAALQSPQPMASLTSNELYSLLNDPNSQQQLPDSYNMPLLQQPQLQQYFMQQTNFDSVKPFQSYSAVVRPSHPGTVIDENTLFKPDPTYLKKVHQGKAHHNPAFHSYQKLTQPPVVTGKNKIILHEPIEPSRQNYVRSTAEGVHQQQQQQAILADVSENINRSNGTEHQVPFKPLGISPSEYNKSFLAAYFNEIDHIASSSITPEHLQMTALQNSEKEQQEEDIIERPTRVTEYGTADSNTFGNYFDQSGGGDDDFVPSQGVFGQHAPMRIYVPDQYEDGGGGVQQTSDIKVSASMNTGDAVKNDMTIVFGDDSSEERHESTYTYNGTYPISEFVDHDDIITSTETSFGDDVIVRMPHNVTNPTLDIHTKDWKTSIVIKPKTSSGSKTRTAGGGHNYVSDYGNRIAASKTKRDE